MPPTSPFKVEVHRSLESSSGIWPRSDRDTGGRCFVFQCADLIEVWRDTIGSARQTETCLVAVRTADDQPILLLPLGIERRRGVAILTFLDASIADYNIPVLFPRSSALGSEDIRDLWDAVLRALPRIDVVFLDKMPEHVGGLSNPLVRLGATPIGISGHATALTGSWTSFEATRLPRRRTLRRYRRRLAAIGPVRFEIPESPERREKVLAAMVRQKERRFAETGATGFRSPGKMEFFLEAGRRLAEGPVHLSALVVGDEIVATHLGYVYDRRFYQIMPTYEGGPWQALSVGRLLHEDLIEWSFRNGIGIFDFGIGDEAYKLEYCDEMLPLHRIVMPLTAAGRIYLTALDARDRIRDSALWARVRAFKRGLSPSPSGPGDDEP